MKKAFSMVLAVIMVLALVPATAAFADEDTAIIQIATWNGTGYSEPSGNYTSIDSAASAAGVHGKIIMSAGDFYFNSRQTISINQITLVGQLGNDGKPATHFITGSDYASSSQTNRKALLTITANDVIVENIEFDGGEYGRTLVPVYNDADTEFSVVRINSGSANFNNVVIKQSERTLLTIGTSSTSATFTATNLYCEGNNKTIPDQLHWNVFADIDVERGSFSCSSGELDAYLQVGDNGTVISMPAYHYTFNRNLAFIPLVNVKTTAKHFVDSYNYIVEQGGSVYSSNVENFKLLVRAELDDAVSHIVDDMCANSSHFGSNTVNGFIAILNEAKSGASYSDRNKIAGYISRLTPLFPTN